MFCLTYILINVFVCVVGWDSMQKIAGYCDSEMWSLQ